MRGNEGRGVCELHDVSNVVGGGHGVAMSCHRYLW